MFRLILLSIGLIATNIGFSQIIDNTEGKTFGDVPFFNVDFIQRNKVKSIRGYYSTKATLDIIRKSTDFYCYEFNRAGQLVKDYNSQFGDTLVRMYEYDQNGRLSILRKSDKHGFESYHYIYDERGRILSEEYRRDLNKTGDKTNFELDKTYSVSIEKFEYLDLEGLNYKKIYYNTNGKIYMDEFYYFDEHGFLIRQEGRLKMGSGLSDLRFVYDEKGRVIEKILEKKMMGNYTSKWIYEYDEHSNVLAQHYYKNAEYITEHQLVYFQESMLLKAIITRDEATDFMTILQFTEYQYFD